MDNELKMRGLDLISNPVESKPGATGYDLWIPTTIDARGTPLNYPLMWKWHCRMMKRPYLKIAATVKRQPPLA